MPAGMMLIFTVAALALRSLPLAKYPVPETSLPIWEIHSQIIDSLRTGNRLILSAPTGSGKTTQVPQMLLQSGLLDNGQVVILQPRRLAARLLATRVAEELGVKLGREVGYQIRFENVTSAVTKKFVSSLRAC